MDDAPEARALISGADELLETQSLGLRHLGRTLRFVHRHRLDQRRIQAMASTDRLTGQANRARFMRELRDTLSAARRSGMRTAVLLVDLDHFKLLNDQLGHAEADQVLRMVGRILEEGIRSTDLVARMGADEFAILLRHLERSESAGMVASKLLESLTMEHRNHPLSASIGIAVAPDMADDLEALVGCADQALFQAKSQGRRGYRFYDADLHQAFERERVLASALEEALAKGHLKLHYQPIQDAQTGRVVGAEALARWEDERLGWISPGEFLPLAERLGQLSRLGVQLLGRLVEDVSRWESHGLDLQFIAYNVAANQLERSLLDAVDRVSLRTPLEIELVESARLGEVGEVLSGLVARNIHLVLDDFGTGFNSLHHLRHLPLTKLKIDREFVTGCLSDARDDRIIHAVVALGRAMGLTVVAEGVEQAEQAHHLRRAGCHQLQGYHLGRPCSPEDFLIRTSKDSWS